MPDPQTTNLDLYIPVRGADVGIWDVPANANMSQLDTVLGGLTSIALTNINVVLSSAQYNCGFINLTGILTGNVGWQGGGAFRGTLYNCTLTGNLATGAYGTGYGGGACESILHNCTITANQSRASALSDSSMR